jgi:hypothetical protein
MRGGRFVALGRLARLHAEGVLIVLFSNQHGDGPFGPNKKSDQEKAALTKAKFGEVIALLGVPVTACVLFSGCGSTNCVVINTDIVGWLATIPADLGSREDDKVGGVWRE